MKKTAKIVLAIVLGISLVAFFGCDKDNGSESDNDSLVGKWESVKEVVTVPGVGQAPITPDVDMFMFLIIDVKEDNTLTYEQWNEVDIDGDGVRDVVEYEAGSGTWSTDGSAFQIDFEGDDPYTLEGTFDVDGDKLVITTALVIDMFGEDLTPIEITFEAAD